MLRELGLRYIFAKIERISSFLTHVYCFIRPKVHGYKLPTLWNIFWLDEQIVLYLVSNQELAIVVDMKKIPFILYKICHIVRNIYTKMIVCSLRNFKKTFKCIIACIHLLLLWHLCFLHNLTTKSLLFSNFKASWDIFWDHCSQPKKCLLFILNLTSLIQKGTTLRMLIFFECLQPTKHITKP